MPDLQHHLPELNPSQLKFLYHLIDEQVIGKDVDKTEPPFNQHDYGFMSANAVNHSKATQRLALKKLMGTDNE